MGEVLVEEVAVEELHSLQFGRVGDNPVPAKSRERIGHLIQNPLLIVPMKGRVTGHGGWKAGERIAQEATKVYRAQVETSKGDARNIFQHLSGAAVQMGAAHRAVPEGFLHPFDMGLIRVFDDDLLRAVGGHTDQPIAYDAGNSDPALCFGARAT
jgi:hypothetical protein